MPQPLAYFITFSTYGTWLHGRADGSIDRQHNLPGTPSLPVRPRLEIARRRSMRQEPYLLDEPRRSIVLRTIREVSQHRRWELWAAHVRTTHVHVIVAASDSPEKVMSDLKAWASRRLREEFGELASRDRWTQHGSTRWIDTEESLAAAIAYVVEEQGDPMACFDGRGRLKFEMPGGVVLPLPDEPDA